MFPAIDENELVELINMMIGIPSKEMIRKAKKKNQFFDKDGNVIMSTKSRVFGVETLSFPLENSIFNDGPADELFLNFILKCLEVDPALRWGPDEALIHPWL